jgi:hypothetical protein
MATVIPIKGGFRITHTTREVWGVDDDDAPETPSIIEKLVQMQPDALDAYERCTEFRLYLLAHLEWETAHDIAAAKKTDTTRTAEQRAWDYRSALLVIARKTPEHLAAFGY